MPSAARWFLRSWPGPRSWQASGRLVQSLLPEAPRRRPANSISREKLSNSTPSISGVTLSEFVRAQEAVDLAGIPDMTSETKNRAIGGIQRPVAYREIREVMFAAMDVLKQL